MSHSGNPATVGQNWQNSRARWWSWGGSTDRPRSSVRLAIDSRTSRQIGGAVVATSSAVVAVTHVVGGGSERPRRGVGSAHHAQCLVLRWLVFRSASADGRFRVCRCVSLAGRVWVVCSGWAGSRGWLGGSVFGPVGYSGLVGRARADVLVPGGFRGSTQNWVLLPDLGMHLLGVS